MLVMDAAPSAADSKSEGENSHVMLHRTHIAAHTLKQSIILTDREVCRRSLKQYSLSIGDAHVRTALRFGHP